MYIFLYVCVFIKEKRLYLFSLSARERRSCGQQWRFVKARFGSFAGFGATAVALELPLDAPKMRAFGAQKLQL